MRITLTLLMFFFVLGVSAQVSSVSYECTLDLKMNNPENGLNKLYFSEDKSLYVFMEWPRSTKSELSGKVVSITMKDEEGMPVYTDLTANKQVYKTYYHAPKGHPWILTEKMPKIDWVITKMQKDFAGLNAFFATGAYGGRDYEVWFTPDIPLPLGPHRLNGLPGLILEAKSTDGLVSFVFTGYQPHDQDDVVIAPPEVGNEISRRMLNKFLIQKLLRTEAKSPPEWDDTINDPPVDYEIEKRKWTVFTDFKRERLRKNGGG